MSAAVTVAVFAAPVQAQAVPVPPPMWTSAAGLLVVVLLVATSVVAIAHHRYRPNRTARAREEART